MNLQFNLKTMQNGPIAILMRRKWHSKFYWCQKLNGCYQILIYSFDSTDRMVDQRLGRASKSRFSYIMSISKNTAKEKSTSIYMLLLSCFVILINKLTDQEDIIIGTPAINREHKSLQSIPGPFLNTLMLRVEVDTQLDYSSFLKLIKETVLEALKIEYILFNRIVEDQIPIDLKRFPITSVFFNGLNFIEDGEVDTSLMQAFQSNLGLDTNS